MNSSTSDVASKVLDRSQSALEDPKTTKRQTKFDQPKRDEEAEANRKIKAKRARETRRSTQVCLLLSTTIKYNIYMYMQYILYAHAATVNLTTIRIIVWLFCSTWKPVPTFRVCS